MIEKQTKNTDEFIYIFIVTYSKTKQISNLNYIMCRTKQKPILIMYLIWKNERKKGEKIKIKIFEWKSFWLNIEMFKSKWTEMCGIYIFDSNFVCAIKAMQWLHILFDCFWNSSKMFLNFFFFFPILKSYITFFFWYV